LQTNCERIHPLRCVISDARDKAIRVGLGIETRFAAILEDGIDHADVHQQAFGGASGVREAIVDDPTPLAQNNARSLAWLGGRNETDSE
jgi:hypothetical protein